MYFQIFDKNTEEQFIEIELDDNDIDYLLATKSLAEFDSTHKIRIILKEKK